MEIVLSSGLDLYNCSHFDRVPRKYFILFNTLMLIITNLGMIRLTLNK
jgi:hypothetical protein